MQSLTIRKKTIAQRCSIYIKKLQNQTRIKNSIAFNRPVNGQSLDLHNHIHIDRFVKNEKNVFPICLGPEVGARGRKITKRKRRKKKTNDQ